MSGPISIGSDGEWQKLLSGTSVVVADFYADWCGPCKMIAPTFEALAKEHSRPKKVAFAKINVDSQGSISRANGVSAMPTFKIFHNGACIETIKGANPPALTAAINNAVKLAGPGGKTGDVFKTPGRTLGGDTQVRAAFGAKSYSITKWLQMLVSFIGLYFVSLFTIDPYKTAENSMFNIHREPPPQRTSKPGAPGGRPAQKSTFKTLADLGGD